MESIRMKDTGYLMEIKVNENAQEFAWSLNFGLFVQKLDLGPGYTI